MKTYQVRSLSGQAFDHDAWGRADTLKDFIQPWTDTAVQRTLFRALYDEDWLYLRYDVKDREILVSTDRDHKLDVADSDRIEIFFRTDEDLERYYCLELDPLGRVLDYRASFYRDFDYTWRWPQEELSVRAEVHEDGYLVEAKVSLKSLVDLGILKDGNLNAGIFRGDCQRLGTGNGEAPSFNWITWVDPGTDTPDFHVKSAFGKLILG